MIRRIIRINKNKCDGCGLCAEACHEGAIGIIDGKARLLREDYCDGLGDCLPSCPTGAITFEEREAEAYNEDAVKIHMAKMGKAAPSMGCPGSSSHSIGRNVNTVPIAPMEMESQLNQWPVQIKLLPVNAPYFKDANLLIAADCTAFAYANFHNEFMHKKITLIGCPKLDDCNYSHKLTEILVNNDVKSVTVVRMEVPCCGGIENATKIALKNSGKLIQWRVVTISTDGRILGGM